MEHPWFTESDAELQQHNLENNLFNLRRWNAKRKFRKGVHAVIGVNRLKNFASGE